MDRRVLLASLILLAGVATGVGVALFAFVGFDDASTDTEIRWESPPANAGDGSGAAVATVGGDPLVVQPATVDGNRSVRAVDADGDVDWTVPVPDDSGETSGVVTGDLGTDDDSVPVAAFTTDAGDLVALDPSDGSERFVVPLDGPGGFRPAIGDVDDDGRAEVAAVDADGGVVAVDAAGETVLDAAVDGEAALPPVVVAADADPDGGPPVGAGVAVVTENETGNRTVSLLDAGGERRWTATPEATPIDWNGAPTRRGPVLALGTADGRLIALEGADGSVRYDVSLQDVPVAVGETDAGRIHVGGTGDVWAVNLLDGEILWRQQYGAGVRVNAPAVGDVTGDGTPNPVAVNRGGGVLGMDAGGTPVLRGGPENAVVYGGPLPADVTGDGTAEVLVVREDGTVVALET